MPNHCSNTLIVTGPDLDRADFQRRARLGADTGGMRLQKALAYSVEPTELSLERIAPGCDDWGTKWIDGVCTDHSSSQLEYGFDSAWTPPVYAVTAASRDFPLLHFQLYAEEQGCDVLETNEIENGVCTCTDHSETHFVCNSCGRMLRLKERDADENGAVICGVCKASAVRDGV